jgi:tRNA-dihydrouridine synthase
VVHARKAWLKGLSPKENRDIPPLDYELVYRLKRERQNLTIAINGGVPSVEAALEHLAHGVDGVMLGRAAYHEPACWARSTGGCSAWTSPMSTASRRSSATSPIWPASWRPACIWRP